MPPKFGTSGLRGLVTDLTADLVGAHVRAFIAACPLGTGLWLGRDLRGSSPDIAGFVADAARAMGVDVTDCGAIPTPALALAAMQAGAGAVMITGSHIPADRNGLKFYTPEGEITKDHETAILAALGTASTGGSGALHINSTAAQEYLDRYVSAYGARALAGLRIGNYAHSAVGRDLTAQVLVALGAEVIDLGRSDVFVPVDTEAVDPATRALLSGWATRHHLDAVVSTDGDGDRPLMADAEGQIIVGDILGQITAFSLGAAHVVTPVSSNTGAELGGAFARVIRTRIGSPFVIAGMEAHPGRTVGYEANGGFLLGFDATGPANSGSGPLPALMTRDSLLPIIAPLALARAQNITLADLVARQPARFTAADRLQEVPTEASQALVQTLTTDASARRDFTAPFGADVTATDTTDGLRMTLVDGRILHLRPSGNAPELRLYVEASSRPEAEASLATGLDLLRKRVDAG